VRRRRRGVVAVALAGALVMAACSSSGSSAKPVVNSTTRAPKVTGAITVSAAASLTEAFGEIGTDFEAANPGTTVTFNLRSSATLANQIEQGAPADVFASADEANMQKLTDDDLAGSEPVAFASNTLEIAVPPGNPAGITTFQDLAKGGVKLVVCAPEVPCGAAAEDVFAAAGVTPEPDTLEEDVRAALTKVELGEVDAALVYASDVASAGEKVEGIAFPEAEDAVNDYPICVLADAPNPEAARAFVALVRSEEGQQALADAGFRAP